MISIIFNKYGIKFNWTSKKRQNIKIKYENMLGAHLKQEKKM